MGYKQEKERNELICKTYLENCPHCGGRPTLEEVGKLFKLSRSRVHKIVTEYGYPNSKWGPSIKGRRP